MKVGLALINVLMALTKSVMKPLGLTAAASAEDAEIYKKSSGLRVLVLLI